MANHDKSKKTPTTTTTTTTTTPDIATPDTATPEMQPDTLPAPADTAMDAASESTQIVAAADLSQLDAAEVLRRPLMEIGAALDTLKPETLVDLCLRAGATRMPAIIAAAAETDKAMLARVFSDDGLTCRKYIPILPHIAHKLIGLELVVDEDIERALAGLPEENRTAYAEMMARMNPEKPGVYTTNNRFQVADLRIFQGGGTDQARPKLAPAGTIYSGDSLMHAVPETHADLLKTPTKMRAAVIGLFDAQQLWPLKDKNQQIIQRPGFPESTRNAPQCTSLDRVKGSYLGDCKSCALAPFANGVPDKNGCQSEVQLYLVLQGFKGIYRFTVSSTSMKPGVGPIKQKLRAWPFPWFSWFDFSTKENTEGSNRWFTLETSVALDGGKNADTTPAEREMLSVLSRRIESEVYIPGLASIWNRADREAPVNEPKSNMGGMMAAAGAVGALPAAGAPPAAAPPPNYGSGNI